MDKRLAKLPVTKKFLKKLEPRFGTLSAARETLEEWQEDYNWCRPHSALGNLTPMEFLQRKTMEKMAA
tara:strand:- start:361 stop:564 length:204 start_codon:yes stop_codon:yes gene_type:complete